MRGGWLWVGLLWCGALTAAEPIWDLKRLSETPKYEWQSPEGPVRTVLYENEPFGGKPTRVFAYVARPEGAAAKSLPGVVLIHGGGGTAFKEWTELWAKRGYAAIAMDLAGSKPIEGKNPNDRNARERLPDGGPGQSDEDKFFRIDQPKTEQWTYHAIAAVVRAHSLLRSLPEVDPDRTAVTGISWGGYLTCITAGVDPRFKASVPVYGCGFLHENSTWLGQFAKLTPEQKAKWVEQWDPSRHLPHVTAPIFFVNGTNDFAYPLDSYQKCIDVVPGAKNVRITVNMPHSHPAGWNPPEIGLFIDHYCKNGKGLAQIAPPTVIDGQARATFESPVRPKSAALHWTTDTGAINKRTWKSADAELQDNNLVAAAPADATVWFFTLIDERDAVVSSGVVMRKE